MSRERARIAAVVVLAAISWPSGGPGLEIRLRHLPRAAAIDDLVDHSDWRLGQHRYRGRNQLEVALPSFSTARSASFSHATSTSPIPRCTTWLSLPGPGIEDGNVAIELRHEVAGPRLVAIRPLERVPHAAR